MKTFTFNGKKINAKELNFNDICFLEDNGINIMELGDMNKSKIFNLIRCYIALHTNLTPEQVGNNADDIDFNEVMECFAYSMENSGFFRNLTKGAEKETTKVQSKEK